MAIGWAHSDGTSGVYDNPSEAIMEHTQKELQADPKKEYPTEIDRGISMGNDLPYGDPSAGYFDNFRLNAKVRSIDKYDLADRVNANQPLNDKLEPITYDKSNELHRAWLAARKSGLATIGFDPHVSVSSPDDGTQLTLAGLYRRKDDTIWYDSGAPDALVHESMHRGYAKLKEEGIVPKNSVYDEETIVRALIQKHLGDVELSGKDKPTAGDKQVLAGRDLLARHGDYLDRLESDAAKYYATKRGKKSTELEQPSMHEQLASFQQRLDATPPAEASELQKFFGSLNIMPRPGKPQEEWTAKEHLGVMLNTAMAGMGGGFKAPPRGPVGVVPPKTMVTPLQEQLSTYETLSSQGKTTKQIVKGTKLDPEQVREALGRDNLAIAAFNSENSLTNAYFKSLEKLDPALGEALKKQVSVKDLKRYTRGLPEEQLKTIFEDLPSHVKEAFESGEQRRLNIDAGKKSKVIPKSSGEIAEKISFPAIRFEGKIYEGINHADAAEKAGLWQKLGQFPDEALAEGFTTNRGRFISREEASSITKSKTKSLHSSDLK